MRNGNSLSRLSARIVFSPRMTRDVIFKPNIHVVLADALATRHSFQLPLRLANCHIHLIPRRRGDILDPRGGVTRTRTVPYAKLPRGASREVNGPSASPRFVI